MSSLHDTYMLTTVIENFLIFPIALIGAIVTNDGWNLYSSILSRNLIDGSEFSISVHPGVWIALLILPGI